MAPTSLRTSRRWQFSRKPIMRQGSCPRMACPERAITKGTDVPGNNRLKSPHTSPCDPRLASKVLVGALGDPASQDARHLLAEKPGNLEEVRGDLGKVLVA